MAKRGPKPKSNATKAQRGTAQPCRKIADVFAVDLVTPGDTLPSAPDWFFDLEDCWSPKKWLVAFDTFERNMANLYKNGRLRRQHIDALANLAVLQADFYMAAAAGSVTGSLISQITRLQTALGIIPDGKEAVAPLSKPKENKFAARGQLSTS